MDDTKSIECGIAVAMNGQRLGFIRTASGTKVVTESVIKEIVDKNAKERKGQENEREKKL